MIESTINIQNSYSRLKLTENTCKSSVTAN